MPSQTTDHNIPFALGTDAANTIDDTMEALAERVDELIVAHDAGSLAGRPTSTPGSPGIEGRVYRVNSGAAIGMVNYDTGTGWITLRDPDPGVVASRPAANTVPAGTQYFATDSKAGYLSDGTNWHWVGGQVPHVRVFDSGIGQSMPGSATAMTFNAEMFDSEGMHSTSSDPDRLTCITPGLYLVEGSFQCVGAATQDLRVFLSKGGVTLDAARQPAVASGVYDLKVRGLTRLAASDYMQIKLQSTTGTPGFVNTGTASESTFEAVYLGP